MATTPNAQARRQAADGGGSADTVPELVLYALDSAYYEWLPDSNQFRGSPALLAQFGYAPGTWTRQCFWDLIHPEDRPAYQSAQSAFLAGGADRAEFAYRASIANGQYRWLRERAAVQRDVAGRAVRLVGTVTDITDAKRRETENRDLVARQAASIEVLKAISASPDDTRPVFELIARRARELCDARTVVVVEYDGALMHTRGVAGIDAVASEQFRQAFPRPPGPETIVGRVVLARQVIHIRDMNADPGIFQPGRDFGANSYFGVPLLHGDQVIGAISLGRLEAGGFDEADVALVQSFAEQAVIAIASATTLRELRTRTVELAQRNSEYGERIEQQAATIDVLKVMSASPGDARPVFELIAERARTFCEADKVSVALLDGDTLHLAAHTAFDEGFDRDYVLQFPRPLDASSVFGRAIFARTAVQSPDLSADPQHLSAQMSVMGVRSVAGVPIMRAGNPIGAIALARRAPGAYSATQVELLQTFAEQAVIAIGSAETYRELQARTSALAERNTAYSEQIEHQSATIDVLKAMSASPGDAQPVFDLIVRRATEICDAPNAVLFRFDGELLHWQATSGSDTYASPEAFDAIRRRFPMAPNRASLVGRTVLERQVLHVRDIDTEPELYQALRDLNTKSLLSVPLLRDGVVLGVIGISAREAGGFTDTQLALLQTFAEQAVIAIGSAATYRELQARTAALAERNSEYGERIEHQSATIDVLKVMSASPGDTQPVFDLIVRRATALCNSSGAGLLEYDGELVHYRSAYGANPAATRAYASIFPMVPTRASLACRAILDKQIVHIRDVDAEPGLLQVARNLGMKSNIALPLMRDDAVIGVFTLTANEIGGFSDSQVALLQTSPSRR